MFWTIILIILVTELCIVAYVNIRNQWVYEQRIRLVLKDMETYHKLPSYNHMLYGHGFWKWDINYYLPEEKEDV